MLLSQHTNVATSIVTAFFLIVRLLQQGFSPVPCSCNYKNNYNCLFVPILQLAGKLGNKITCMMSVNASRTELEGELFF